MRSGRDYSQQDADQRVDREEYRRRRPTLPGEERDFHAMRGLRDEDDQKQAHSRAPTEDHAPLVPERRSGSRPAWR